jgi:hypothetical protein
MKNVLKKSTAGEVQKTHSTTDAAIVMLSSGHRGSCGQVASDEGLTKLKDLGNVDGNPRELMPFFFEAWKECAAPSRRTTPQPPSLSMTPA